jgi:hypothetical protein
MTPPPSRLFVECFGRRLQWQADAGLYRHEDDHFSIIIGGSNRHWCGSIVTADESLTGTYEETPELAAAALEDAASRRAGILRMLGLIP